MKEENSFLNNFMYPLMVGIILAWITFSFFSKDDSTIANRVVSETQVDSTKTRDDDKGYINTKDKNTESKYGKQKEENKSSSKINSENRESVNVISIKDNAYKESKPIFEMFFADILRELNLNGIIIKGKSNVRFSPNETVNGQIRATIEINVSIDSQPLILPILYGRGDQENEAIRHSLDINRELISNKIKQLQ